MSSPFEMLMDHELIAMLQRRGYIVRHESEARHPLSWNRSCPMPEGLDFKKEAVEKLREQITPELIQFRVEPAVEHPFTRPEIHSAFLRVL